MVRRWAGIKPRWTSNALPMTLPLFCTCWGAREGFVSRGDRIRFKSFIIFLVMGIAVKLPRWERKSDPVKRLLQ